MAEGLVQVSGTKEDVYSNILVQIQALVGDEKDAVANLANVSAALSATFNFLWVGFYIIEKEQLRLGPFQGPVACTRISKGKGVCGSAWSRKETVIVNDVHQFAGHIACSADSNSEIVLPLLVDHVVMGVLDIDSTAFDYFDEMDRESLEKIVKWFASVVY